MTGPLFHLLLAKAPYRREDGIDWIFLVVCLDCSHKRNLVLGATTSFSPFNLSTKVGIVNFDPA